MTSRARWRWACFAVELGHFCVIADSVFLMRRTILSAPALSEELEAMQEDGIFSEELEAMQEDGIFPETGTMRRCWATSRTSAR